MVLYFIEHIRKIEKIFLEEKYIGVCSTQEKALEVIKKFKTYEGFEDFPDDFRIKKYFIDKLRTENKKEINRVYLLGFYHEYADDTVDLKILGIFSTQKRAKEYLKKYKAKHLIKPKARGFYVERWLVNSNFHWEGGFLIQG